MEHVYVNHSEHLTPPHTEIKSNLFALLPLSEQAQLSSKDHKGKFLHLLNSITSIALKGLKAFKARNLNQLDAQIGENLCQMRAYHITYLARKYLFSVNEDCLFQSNIDVLTDYQKITEHTLNQWNQKVQTTSKYDKYLDASESTLEFMKRKELFIELNDDVVYLAASYFLAHFSTKVDGILQSISLTQVAEELSIAKSQAKKLVQTFQNTICKLGVNFVTHILDDLPQLSHYQKLLPDLLKDSADSRLVLPCFAVSDIIFQHALYTQTPILLSINRVGTYIDNKEVVYGLIIADQYGSPLLTDYEEYLSHACVVIEAQVDYEAATDIETIQMYVERLVLNNPVYSLLANTAMHPQYAGQQLQYLVDNPYLLSPNSTDKQQAEQSFQQMKEFAKDFGCHKENATTLFMKHAYSNTVENQISTIQNKTTNTYDAYELVSQNLYATTQEAIHLMRKQPQTMNS